MNRKELIKSYLNFFKSKGHAIVLSSSLIPENDASVLFTTAGMHPLVPYLMGEKHASGKRVANVQKCIRTSDIDEVGDEFHHTFFEMLGNWSFGDYFKKEAIEYSFEFLTKILKLKGDMLAVSCFEGNKDAEKDDEAANAWLALGISKEKIAFMPKENNWWGPAGETGPCGPDTEMFFYVGKGKPKGNPKTNEKQWCEIWNDVFMQYNKNSECRFIPLKQKNVDTGMGVERTIAVLNKINDDYLTDAFLPIIKKIEEISKKKYEDKKNTKAMRVIADHLKAAVFILGDERHIVPANVDQGYVLRKLIRRAIRYGKELGIERNFCTDVAEEAINIYKDDYKELKKNEKFILNELEKEENKFHETLEKGLREFEKISENKKEISGKDSFFLYQSFGLPLEVIKDIAKENKIKINEKGFQEEYEKHQKLSRVGAEKKFKGGLGEISEVTTRLHTATHLLNEALRRIVDKNIHQRGSNITPERLRFDFNYSQKLSDEQIKKVEDEVNNIIKKAMSIERKEMSVEEAKKHGAQAMFSEKYGEKVSIYKIGDYSFEICAGPHVKNTKELGKFKIIKEEAVAAGIRRIKAILE